jgi:hypothetical protein
MVIHNIRQHAKPSTATDQSRPTLTQDDGATGIAWIYYIPRILAALACSFVVYVWIVHLPLGGRRLGVPVTNNQD